MNIYTVACYISKTDVRKPTISLKVSTLVGSLQMCWVAGWVMRIRAWSEPCVVLSGICPVLASGWSIKRSLSLVFVRKQLDNTSLSALGGSMSFKLLSPEPRSLAAGMGTNCTLILLLILFNASLLRFLYPSFCMWETFCTVWEWCPSFLTLAVGRSGDVTLGRRAELSLSPVTLGIATSVNSFPLTLQESSQNDLDPVVSVNVTWVGLFPQKVKIFDLFCVFARFSLLCFGCTWVLGLLSVSRKFSALKALLSETLPEEFLILVSCLSILS